MRGADTGPGCGRDVAAKFPNGTLANINSPNSTLPTYIYCLDSLPCLNPHPFTDKLLPPSPPPTLHLSNGSKLITDNYLYLPIYPLTHVRQAFSTSIERIEILRGIIDYLWLLKSVCCSISLCNKITYDFRVLHKM